MAFRHIKGLFGGGKRKGKVIILYQARMAFRRLTEGRYRLREGCDNPLSGEDGISTINISNKGAIVEV